MGILRQIIGSRGLIEANVVRLVSLDLEEARLTFAASHSTPYDAIAANIFCSSRNVGQEAVHGRAQIGGLIRQVARGCQYEIGGAIGVLGCGRRSSNAPGDAFRSGGRMPDAPRYFARRRVLLTDGLSNRRREAINLIH